MLTSKRLAKLAEFVDENDFVADIGADHGKLIIEIANKYKNNKYLAVENKVGPFNNLKEAVDKYNFNKNIECSLSDGIEYLLDHINTLIIAGMGGFNVVTIIKNSLKNLKNIKKIIFSVHRNMLDLESILKTLGYFPVKSALVEENNQFYEIVETKFFKEYALIELDENGNPIENANAYENLLKIYENKENNEILDRYYGENHQKIFKKSISSFITDGFINEN
jgi:tRNA (adenine22-N1)-methyltransferase